jgi:hypothetical protein
MVMDWLIATIKIGLATAVATTFDDNIYLTAFFSEVNRTFRPQHVVVGEILGFTGIGDDKFSWFLNGASDSVNLDWSAGDSANTNWLEKFDRS